MNKLTTLEALIRKRGLWRFKNLKLVWIAVSFDRLQAGHVRMFRQAKELGDILVVGIHRQRKTNDAGGRLMTPAAERAELIASLECVDHTIILNSDNPKQLLHSLQPEVYCMEAGQTRGRQSLVAETSIVRNYGGQIATLALPEKTAHGDTTPDPAGDCSGQTPGQNVPDMSLIERFSSSRALVIGDVMLDEYVMGNISRVSPEAPVPILDVQARRYACGGAANVATNMARLSGFALLSGVIGRDQSGATLRSHLQDFGVQLDALLELETAQTICKTRFVAGQQQIVRVDQERRLSLTEPERSTLLEQISRTIPQVDVCVISDYSKGLLDERMCQDIIRVCLDCSKPIVVDPKGSNFRKYRGCSLITPNVREAGIATGRDVKTFDDLEAAGADLLETLPGTAILVTRGPDGMTLFRTSMPSVSIPTVARKVFDVVGAGDTAVATLAVALGAKFDIEHAIQLANIAAGVAVEQHGTVAVGIDELAARAATLQLFQASQTAYRLNTAVA